MTCLHKGPARRHPNKGPRKNEVHRDEREDRCTRHQRKATRLRRRMLRSNLVVTPHKTEICEISLCNVIAKGKK